LEVLILKDLKNQEFYGSIVDLEIHGFLRAEAKFNSFDEFIYAMSNDV